MASNKLNMGFGFALWKPGMLAPCFSQEAQLSMTQNLSLL